MEEGYDMSMDMKRNGLSGVDLAERQRQSLSYDGKEKIGRNLSLHELSGVQKVDEKKCVLFGLDCIK